MTGDQGEHTGSSRSSNSTIKRFPLSPKRLVFIRVVVVEGHDGAVIKKSEKAHKGCCRIAIMADTVTKISRKDNRCKLNDFLFSSAHKTLPNVCTKLSQRKCKRRGRRTKRECGLGQISPDHGPGTSPTTTILFGSETSPIPNPSQFALIMPLNRPSY